MDLASQLKDINQRVHLASMNVLDVPFGEDIIMEMYIAIESSERQRGLAGLSSLDLQGMLFVYQQPSMASFTMEGMEMDLDIGFYDQDGKLLHIGSYTTDYLEPIRPWPEKAFSYVVEAPAGTLPPEDLRLHGR